MENPPFMNRDSLLRKNSLDRLKRVELDRNALNSWADPHRKTVLSA